MLWHACPSEPVDVPAAGMTSRRATRSSSGSGRCPTDGRSKQRPYVSDGAMTDNPVTHTISGRANNLPTRLGEGPLK